MERNVCYDAELDIIIARLSGPVTVRGLRLLSEEVLSLVASHRCLRLLSDVRAVTAIQLSFVDIYAIPKTLVAQFSYLGFQPYQVKRAVVVPGWSPLFSFFEDVANNRMLNTKVFLELEPAKAWLVAQGCQDV